jgi:hypothetical protein
MTKIITVFTGKNLEWMEKEGGSGYWIAQGHRITTASYLLCVRNHRETWAVKNDGVEHGQAFLIARGVGWKKSKEYTGRKVITFKEYAELPDTASFKKAWKALTDGQRYPVSYLDITDVFAKLNINQAALDWKPFSSTATDIVDESKLLSDQEDEIDDGKDLAEIIIEAKEMVANAAGVDISKIMIQVAF